MFRKKRPEPTPTFVVPRIALVQALARATYDGNAEAVAAAERLLKLCDEGNVKYVAV